MKKKKVFLIAVFSSRVSDKRSVSYTLQNRFPISICCNALNKWRRRHQDVNPNCCMRVNASTFRFETACMAQDF